MTENLPPQDGLESYLVNAFDGYEGETPAPAVWDAIEAGLPVAPVVPFKPWYSQAITWAWGGGIAAAVLVVAIGYQFLSVNQEINSLKEVVADKSRQIEQLRQADTAYSPGMHGGQAQRAGESGTLSSSNLANSPDSRTSAEGTGKESSGGSHQLQTQAPAPPPRVQSQIAPSPSWSGVQPKKELAPASLQTAASVQVLPPTPIIQASADLLNQENRPIQASLAKITRPLSVLPTPATASIPVVPVSHELKLKPGIAIKASWASQGRWLKTNETSTHEHGPMSFSPQKVISQSDYRTGLGLILRSDKLLAFETGLYVQSRQEVAEHQPRLDFHRGGGPGGQQNITYQLYTPQYKTDVSVTVVPNSPLPDSSQVALTVVTEEHSQSVQVPLLLRISAPLNRLRLSARGGLLVQYNYQQDLKLVSATSDDNRFALSSDQLPTVRVHDESKLATSYFMGIGAEWRISTALGVALEPYTYGKVMQNKMQPKRNDSRDLSLFGGAELSVVYHF